MIKFENVSKQFRKVQALEDVSLEIPRGKITALLGPNGAGKTTLMKILFDFVRPDKGKVWINSLHHRDSESRRGVAYLPERFVFYPYETIKDTLVLFGKMRNLRGKELNNALEKVFEDKELKEFAHRTIKTLSKGQLQRVGIATLLMGENHLFILDEPFTGLDPTGIKWLKDCCLTLKSEGKTVVTSSHMLGELESFVDRVAIINKGKCLEKGRNKQTLERKTLSDFFHETLNNAETT